MNDLFDEFQCEASDTLRQTLAEVVTGATTSSVAAGAPTTTVGDHVDMLSRGSDSGSNYVRDDASPCSSPLAASVAGHMPGGAPVRTSDVASSSISLSPGAVMPVLEPPPGVLTVPGVCVAVEGGGQGVDVGVAAAASDAPVGSDDRSQGKAPHRRSRRDRLARETDDQDYQPHSLTDDQLEDAFQNPGGPSHYEHMRQLGLFD